MTSPSGGSKNELASALEAVVDSFAGAKPVTPSVQSVAPEQPVDGKQQLLSAYDRLVEHEAAKPRVILPPADPLWKRFVAPVILLASLGAIGYLWIAQPAWLYPRFEPVPVPPQTAKASQLLIATSLMIDDYRSETGHLPEKLSDLGVDFEGLAFADLGNGSYQLVTAGPHRLRLIGRPDADPQVEPLR